MSDAELDALLAEPVEVARAREARAFDDASRGRPIVLMGSGGLGRRTLAGLRAVGVTPLAFADNDVSRQGTEHDGLRILSPEDAAREFGATAAFVVTIWGANSPHRFEHTREQLRDLGCDVIVPFPLLYWKYPSQLIPHYLIELPHRVLEQAADVRRAYALWDDDASRAEYLAQLRLRLHADFDGLSHPAAHPQYFPDDLYAWRDDECIVDGGAYDGDSIRSLVVLHGDAFKRVIAFEPDPANFAKLEATVAALPVEWRSRITLLRMALGDASGTLPMAATGTASSAMGGGAAEETVQVAVEPLDDVIDGARPTFIKFDIEGAEPEALRGARRTIEAFGPVCAICVYHRQDHLWQLPLMLHEWRRDYAFYLRPHNEEGWDLVCYAVPRARLTGAT
ncbi:MAG: FkbM family methyltransferase [Proteobacteria bacterium]|nr:FkbM family methyltransferase [Pseudomonadota bacterium]